MKRKPVGKKGEDQSFLESARSICPECRKVIDAQILVKNGKVYMKKFCKEHGWFEGLISSDASMYKDVERYNKPGTSPLHFSTEVKEGCPHDCGLCPDHKQHTCLGVIEITDSCNLSCPVCFADSSCGKSKMLSLEEIEKMINLFVKCEGEPEVLQISGGEPTLHPDIFEIVKLAKEKIRYVCVNTNGIKLADEGFARELGKLEPWIYLQFDTFERETCKKMNGRDIIDLKLKAIENCEKYGMGVTLVPKIARGVNEHEIGDIVKFAVENKAVKGVLFQPLFFSGRNSLGNPMDRVTLPDIVKGIEKQTGGMFRKDDFIPVPCPYPTCSFITYAYVENGKPKPKVTPLPRIVKVDDYIDYFKNKVLADPVQAAEEAVSGIKKALENLLSSSAIGGTDKVADNYSAACGITMPDIDKIKDNVILIGAMFFMDAYTFDMKRCEKCCVHVILPNERIIPFCVYNNLHRQVGTENIINKLSINSH